MALRKRFPGTTLSVWGRREEVLAEVMKRGLADRTSTSLSECVRDCDLVILCTPIEFMAGLAESIQNDLAPGALVTDVGSVKASVHRDLKAILGPDRWLGSHPMAGSEQAGLDAAQENLFQDAVTIVTPDNDTPAAHISKLDGFWKGLGCRVVNLPAAEHDHLISDISHLPHLLAALLVGCADEKSIPLAGPGFRDCTRIAAGSPLLWREILLNNRQALVESLDKLLDSAELARDHLKKGDGDALESILSKACQIRKNLT